MAIHQFSTYVAKEFGIESAVLLNNMLFWIDKNAKNGTHIHDGKCWTYNSNQAFADMFPYMSKTKIFRTLDKLADQGVIIKGNYNISKFDRTTWYALSPKGLELLGAHDYDVESIAIIQNESLHIPGVKNGVTQSGTTIPDINTDNNHHIYNNNNNSGEPRFVKPTYDEVADYCNERGNGIDPEYFIDYYESKGWMVGKSKMKDWKSAVRNWERRNQEEEKRESSAKERNEYPEERHYLTSEEEARLADARNPLKNDPEYQRMKKEYYAKMRGEK